MIFFFSSPLGATLSSGDALSRVEEQAYLFRELVVRNDTFPDHFFEFLGKAFNPIRLGRDGNVKELV